MKNKGRYNGTTKPHPLEQVARAVVDQVVALGPSKVLLWIHQGIQQAFDEVGKGRRLQGIVDELGKRPEYLRLQRDIDALLKGDELAEEIVVDASEEDELEEEADPEEEEREAAATASLAEERERMRRAREN